MNIDRCWIKACPAHEALTKKESNDKQFYKRPLEYYTSIDKSTNEPLNVSESEAVQNKLKVRDSYEEETAL